MTALAVPKWEEEDVMTGSNFLCGMGLGILAGAALGMSLAPRKKRIQRAAERAIRTAGDAMEDLTDALGF